MLHLRKQTMNSFISEILRKHWDALLASVTACIFIYLFTRHSGIGVSPDSVMYASTAANIRAHFSFTDFNGLPLVDFPLGYPLLLALASFITGLSVFQLAPVLNAVLFCALIFFTSSLLNQFRNRSWLGKAAVLSLLACSPALLEVYNMLWSETLFLVLTLWFLHTMVRYLKTERLAALLLAGILVSIAFVTRYAGISLLATGCMLVLFFGAPSLKTKLVHLLAFVSTGISLVLINLLRNQQMAGNSTGVREKALRGLSENIFQLGGVVSEWLPFLRGHEKMTAVLFLCIFGAAATGILFRIFQQQYYASAENTVAAFFVTYTVFILGVATVSRFENLSSRLLSPLYVSLLLLLFQGMQAGVKKLSGILRITGFVIVLVFFAAFHLHHYQLNAEAWEGIQDAGMPGYTEDTWTQSPTVDHIRKNKSRYILPVYGNANDAVYFLTGIHALPLPHKEIPKEIAAFLLNRSFYVIWFRDGENPDLVGLDFIKQHKKLVSVEEMEDGAVYLFNE